MPKVIQLADRVQVRQSGSSPSNQSGGQIAIMAPVVSGDDFAASSLTKNLIVESNPDNPITSSKRLETEELYPLKSEMRPELAAAFTLLQEGLEHTLDAIKAMEKEERMASDSAIVRFQALLPELFCCRTIGDGFGRLINGIYHGLKNFRGYPLNLEQLKTLFKVVRRIKSEPYINDSEAIDELIILEKAGFSVEPEYISPLFEILNDESFR